MTSSHLSDVRDPTHLRAECKARRARLLRRPVDAEQAELWDDVARVLGAVYATPQVQPRAARCGGSCCRRPITWGELGPKRWSRQVKFKSANTFRAMLAAAATRPLLRVQGLTTPARRVVRSNSPRA